MHLNVKTKVLPLVVSLSVALVPFTTHAIVQSINGLTGQNQILATTTSMHMNITSSGSTHTFDWDGTPWLVNQGGTGAISFTNGSILFVANGVFSENNSNLFWDTAANSLSVGGSVSPSAKLNVKGSGDLALLNLASSTGTVLFSVSGTGSTTIANGINITSGCFAMNGACLTIPSVPAQKSKKTQTFTSSGTWVRPASVSEVWVTVVGGGGGGGTSGGDHTSGGGAGGYAYASTTVSGNVTVTIGAGGSAGNSGSDSSFAGDITVIAGGGSAGSGVSEPSSSPAFGGSGGTTTNANIVSITGQSGQSAGKENQFCRIGTGGSAPLGFGGLAANIGNTNGFGTFNGVSATGYGGGGSGECGAGTAGAGSSGIVIVEWWE